MCVGGVEWDSGSLLRSCFPFYISCGGGDDEVGGGLEGGWGHHRVLLWENCLTLQPAECFQPPHHWHWPSSECLILFKSIGRCGKRLITSKHDFNEKLIPIP